MELNWSLNIKPLNKRKTAHIFCFVFICILSYIAKVLVPNQAGLDKLILHFKCKAKRHQLLLYNQSLCKAKHQQLHYFES